MLLEQHFIDFFGNLPNLPKMEIVKHFNQCDLLFILTLSDQWDQLIKINDLDKTVRIKLLNDINFTKMKIKKELSDELFWESCELSIDFSIESSKNGVWEMRNDDEISCYCRNFEKLKESIYKTYQKISKYFSIEVEKIQVNLETGLSLEFLKSFDFGPIAALKIMGDCEKACENEKEVEVFLKDQKILARICVDLENLKSLDLGSHVSLFMQVALSNSSFLTPETLFENISCDELVLKKCTFSSKDLNHFFKLWKEGKKRQVTTAQFYLEKEVVVEELLEGLGTQKWDPKVRGKHFVLAPYMSTLDLSNGHDFFAIDDSVATIILTEDRKKVSLFVWKFKFPVEFDKKILESVVQVYSFMSESGKLNRKTTRRVEKMKEDRLRSLEYLETLDAL